jgi:hypothetical protein
MDGHDNVSGGETTTESSKPNPVDLEADARERHAGADSPEVQPLQKRIITLEDLHQHVLDLPWPAFDDGSGADDEGLRPQTSETSLRLKARVARVTSCKGFRKNGRSRLR